MKTLETYFSEKAKLIPWETPKAQLNPKISELGNKLLYIFFFIKN